MVMTKARIVFLLQTAAVLAVLVSVVYGCSGSISGSKQTDLEKFGIGSQPVSKVKVVCDTIYNRIPEDNYEAVFDASGNLSMLRALYTDGRTMNYESYVYDNEGRLDEILLLDQDSSLTGRYHYEYDGSFISKCTLYGMNNQDIQTWVHSNNGKQIVRTDFYQEGELQTVSKNKWSRKGKVRKETVTDDEDELVGESEYIYISSGKPVSITNDLVNLSITYDGNGLPTSSSDVFVSSKGDLIASEIENKDGSPVIFTYEYTYDPAGRWISRKATLQDGTVYEILTRTIE